jgi:hypothetical protein
VLAAPAFAAVAVLAAGAGVARAGAIAGRATAGVATTGVVAAEVVPPLARATLAAIPKNDVTLMPARRIRVVTAGCRRRGFAARVTVGRVPVAAVV